MTRDTAERAREWLSRNNSSAYDSQAEFDNDVAKLAALLTRVQAESRLSALNQAAEHRPVYDDCGDIEFCVGCNWKCPDWGKKGDPKNDATHWMEHIATLEAQAGRVGKETHE